MLQGPDGEGLTQEELAEAIGVGELRRLLERNVADNPGLRYLTNAALALGVDLDALIGLEWRQWKGFDRLHAKPPDPVEFWRRAYPAGQAYLTNFAGGASSAETAPIRLFLQALHRVCARRCPRRAMNTFSLVKADRWLWRGLRRACDLDRRYGRRRGCGCGQLASGPWRTRTSNLGIKSPLLYQLS